MLCSLHIPRPDRKFTFSEALINRLFVSSNVANQKKKCLEFFFFFFKNKCTFHYFWIFPIFIAIKHLIPNLRHYSRGKLFLHTYLPVGQIWENWHFVKDGLDIWCQTLIFDWPAHDVEFPMSCVIFFLCIQYIVSWCLGLHLTNAKLYEEILLEDLNAWPSYQSNSNLFVM